MMENMSLSIRIGLAITIVVLSAASFLIMLTRDAWAPFLWRVVGDSSQSLDLPKPTGTILITGAKLGGEGADILPQNYAWDLSEPNPKWERVGDLSNGIVYSAFIEPTSVGNPLSVFLRAMIVGQDRDLTESVVWADLVAGQTSLLNISMSDNPKQLSWSEPSRLLAYQGEVTEASSTRSFIRIYEPETQETVRTIEDTWQPLWSPDGIKIVYLRKSGVYYYDLSQDVEVLLMGVKDYDPEYRHLDGNTKIGLSPNGRYLAWTSPSNNALYIFEIKDWALAQLETVQIIRDQSAHFYWPIFSPGSDLVSVQAINIDSQTGFRSDSALRVYAIGHEEVLASMPLSVFDFDQLFTDTWVAASLRDMDYKGYFEQSWSLILPKSAQCQRTSLCETNGDVGLNVVP